MTVRDVLRSTGHISNYDPCIGYGSGERLRLTTTGNFDDKRRSLGPLEGTNAPRLAPPLPAHARGVRLLYCLAHVPPPCLPMAHWQPSVHDPLPSLFPHLKDLTIGVAIKHRSEVSRSQLHGDLANCQSDSGILATTCIHKCYKLFPGFLDAHLVHQQPCYLSRPHWQY